MFEPIELNRRDLLAALLAGATASAARAQNNGPAAARRPALPPEAFGELPTLSQLRPSPQGGRLALVAASAGQRRVMVRNMNEAAWLVRIDVGDMKLRGLSWANEDLLLVEHSQTVNFGGDYDFEYEVGNILVIDCRDGKVHWPLRGGNHLEAVMGFNLVQRRNGRPVLLADVTGSTRLANGQLVPNNQPTDLFEFDLPSGGARLLRAGDPEVGSRVLAPDGSLIAHSRRDVGRRRFAIHAGAQAGKALIDVEDPDGLHALLWLGRSEGTVLWRRPDAQGDPQYVELDLRDPSKQELLQATAGSIQGPIYDATSERLIGLWAGPRGKSWPQYFNPRLAARAEGVRAALPDASLAWGGASQDLGLVSFVSEGAGDAGTWWLARVAEGKAEPAGLMYPALAPEDIGSWRWWRHKASDGLEIEGVLTLPPGARLDDKAPPRALVVLPHGGPATHDSPGFDWWAQAYAHRGYVVWQPNFRGSSGYGEVFRRKGFGEIGRRMQTDLSDGVDALATAGIVDAQRVAIVGASYGGYAALAGVTLQRSIYRCAVAVAPAADWALIGERTVRRGGVMGRRYWEAYLGVPLRNTSALEAISPLAQAAKADAPVLLVHGRDDTVVTVEHSRRMARALRAANKPVEFVELEGEDHWLSLGRTRVAMLKQALGFVQKHNPA